MSITKPVRQSIVREFCERHGGKWNAQDFLSEVAGTGKSHAAYDWFTWDNKDAANKHRLTEARAFVSGLRINYEVEQVHSARNFAVRMTEAPFVLSPLDGRHKGGGYFEVDRDNPDHMAEYCRQASAALGHWLRRYDGALAHAGLPRENLVRVQTALEQVSADKAAA